MFVVGFATAVEIADLQDQGFEVEDAPEGCVGPSVEERSEGYLLTKPEPGPNGTKAVSIFLDAALYDVLLQLKGDEVPEPNSLNVVDWDARRLRLLNKGNALRADGADFKYCNHKHRDGSDARYPTGNGESACICGNKWD